MIKQLYITYKRKGCSIEMNDRGRHLVKWLVDGLPGEVKGINSMFQVISYQVYAA